MKKLFLSCLLLVFFAFTSAIYAQSLLWKISGNGLEAPSYLYGTFHLLCPDDLQFSDATMNAVNESKQLVLELNFDNAELMTKMQSMMFLEDGKTAKDYLSEEDYELVADFFTNKMKLPFEFMANIKPFFLSAMTLMYYLDCEPSSPELEFTAMAKKQEMELFGLETVEEQMGFIDDIPLEEAAQSLVTEIQKVDDGKEVTNLVIEAYKAGEIENLMQIYEDHYGEEYTQSSEKLLNNRNYNWVPKIEEFIQDKATFIAVGAGHLPGKEGVIELLKKEGYKVKPVK